MDVTDKKTIENHIKNHILSSGYPLEIQISNIVDRNGGFTINNTVYFFDEELHTGRSIDMALMSMNTFKPELYPLFLRVDIPIECKKSESHAWVFYERRKLDTNSIYMDGQIGSTNQELTSEVPCFKHIIADKFKLHYSAFKTIAIAYDEVKIQGKSDKRQIFEAINQLIKYICYEIHNTITRVSDIGRQKENELAIMLMMPVIIFDGLLYKASFDSGQLEIKEAIHILLHTQFRCPYCNKVENYAIDIIHSSFFPEFLKLLNANAINSANILNSEKQKIINIAVDRSKRVIEKRKAEISFSK